MVVPQGVRWRLGAAACALALCCISAPGSVAFGMLSPLVIAPAGSPAYPALRWRRRAAQAVRPHQSAGARMSAEEDPSSWPPPR